jgi:hypothetical protein
MGAPQGSKPVQGQFDARGTTYLTAAQGPLLLAYGETECRVTGYLRGIAGNFAVKPRYRKFAVRASNPGTAWTEGTAVTTEVNFSEDFSLASLGAYMFVQPGLGAAVTSGSAGEGFAMMQGWTDTVARIVARQTYDLNPDINSAQSAIIPIGVPFPAFQLSGVMVGIASRSLTASVAMDIVTRTCKGDPEDFSAWDTTGLIGTDHTFGTTAEDYNTGNLAFAPADVAFAQIGLYIPSVSANGSFDVIVAAKY